MTQHSAKFRKSIDIYKLSRHGDGDTAATSARRSAMRTSEADVLVVGAGPAGLSASALLARYGVSAITVTKYASTANSPRAHITNQRTGEVLRDLGIEERVRAFATPSNLMGNNVWAASFAGQEIARLMTWGSGPARRADYDNASPSAMMNAPQHLLEPVLLDAARSPGAGRAGPVVRSAAGPGTPDHR